MIIPGRNQFLIDEINVMMRNVSYPHMIRILCVCICVVYARKPDQLAIAKTNFFFFNTRPIDLYRCDLFFFYNYHYRNKNSDYFKERNIFVFWEFVSLRCFWIRLILFFKNEIKNLL